MPSEVTRLARCAVTLRRRDGGPFLVAGDPFSLSRAQNIGQKVGKPVARQIAGSGKKYLVSECPLAGTHIAQGVDRIESAGQEKPERLAHPIELLARAYGVAG